jgi:hypothetical protein
MAESRECPANIQTTDNPASALINSDIDGRYKALAKYAKSKTGNSSGGIAANFQDKWNELASAKADGKLGVNNVSNLRIAPFIKTKWNQSTVLNKKTNQQEACYNYYTPNGYDTAAGKVIFKDGAPANYVCGCVATATAQVMKYFGYPTAAVPQSSFDITVDGHSATQTIKGGIYNWNNMPDDPASYDQLSESNRQEIGKLC